MQVEILKANLFVWFNLKCVVLYLVCAGLAPVLCGPRGCSCHRGGNLITVAVPIPVTDLNHLFVDTRAQTVINVPPQPSTSDGLRCKGRWTVKKRGVEGLLLLICRRRCLRLKCDVSLTPFTLQDRVCNPVWRLM